MLSSNSQKQIFLDRLKTESKPVARNEIKIINWNVRNPSVSRAVRQMNWLQQTDPDIIVLTETKFSKGCLYVRDRLKNLGYHVAFPIPKENDYGVLLASRIKSEPTKFSNNLTTSRVISAEVKCPKNSFEIVAVYVPNERGDDKKIFLESLLKIFERTPNTHRIFCGDLNILEPDHVPHYPQFNDWEYGFYDSMHRFQMKDAFRHFSPNVQEYSWVGRTGDGYRYDHFFVSQDILPSVQKCYYIHEPRSLKLSDHSAMCLEIKTN